MREIWFRGQTRKKGEKVRLDGTLIDSNWVYGGVFPNNKGGDFAIIYQQYPEIKKYTVYADTVGQYTGLTDKNGKKIFEGDILRRTLKGYYPDISYIFKIVFVPVKAVFAAVDIGGGSVNFISEYINNKYEIDVIGNIHDNPELLEQEG